MPTFAYCPLIGLLIRLIYTKTQFIRKDINQMNNDG